MKKTQFSHHQIEIEMAFTSQLHKKAWSRIPLDRMPDKGAIVALLLHEAPQDSTLWFNQKENVYTHRIHGTGISTIIYITYI